jgi:hypothetical protein
MIGEIIELLDKGEFYGESKSIEVLKGKNELVTTWKGASRKIKRIWRSKKL